MNDIEHVNAIFSASRLVGTVRSIVVSLGTAFHGSATWLGLCGARARWQALPLGQRRTLVGAMLIVAAVTHTALYLTERQAAGWLGLVVPGIAATIGVVVVTAGLTVRGAGRGE